MAATKYTYSIANDTLNGALASDELAIAIQDSAIVTAFDKIQYTDDVLDIWFKDSLSSGDKDILDTLVSEHDGVVELTVDTVHIESARTNYHGDPIIVNREIVGTLFATAANFQVGVSGCANEHCSMNLYDEYGELCNTNSGDAVQTVLDFEPSGISYDIYGGRFFVTDIEEGDMVLLKCIGVPDIPLPNGSKVFVENLRFCYKIADHQIRAANPTYLPYNATYTAMGMPTNKIRITLDHAKGKYYHCSFIPEIYRDYEAEA